MIQGGSLTIIYGNHSLSAKNDGKRSVVNNQNGGQSMIFLIMAIFFILLYSMYTVRKRVGTESLKKTIC